MTDNPIIIHIVSILRKGSSEQLRILYQVIRAVIEPENYR